MRNYSIENDFDLHENETAYRAHFHLKGFALRLVLKQSRHKRTRKWPIVKSFSFDANNWTLAFGKLARRSLSPFSSLSSWGNKTHCFP